MSPAVDPNGLEATLARYLRDAAFRARVAAGAADLDDDAREALDGVDAARAETAAAAIVVEVQGRRHRGVGSLEDVYRDALRPFDEQARRALFGRFVASPQFSSAASVEEAFARFLVDDVAPAPAGVEAALLRATTRSLAVHGAPSFPLPAAVLRRPRGWCAVAPGPILFAAIDGRAIEGPIDDVTAAIVRASSQVEAIDAARAHGLTADAAQRLVDAVAARGLAAARTACEEPPG